MICMEGEPDNVTTIEISAKALDHIKGTERWLGFIAGVGFTLVAFFMVLAILH